MASRSASAAAEAAISPACARAPASSAEMPSAAAAASAATSVVSATLTASAALAVQAKLLFDDLFALEQNRIGDPDRQTMFLEARARFVLDLAVDEQIHLAVDEAVQRNDVTALEPHQLAHGHL